MPSPLPPAQAELAQALISALRTEQSEAIPELWAQIEPQLTPDLVQWLSEHKVIEGAMSLDPPWVQGAQALVAAGAQIKGYAALVMERSLEYQAPDVFLRALEHREDELQDGEFLEGLIGLAIRHQHDAIALRLLDQVTEPLTTLVAVDAARRGRPVDRDIVLATVAHTAPERRSNDYLRLALQGGHWDLAEALWPPVVPLLDYQTREWPQIAARQGREDWVHRLRGDAAVAGPQLAAALKGGHEGTITSLLGQVAPAVVHDAWNELCHAKDWAAVDRLTPVVPRHWRLTLLDMAGPDQAPQALAYERAEQLKAQPPRPGRSSRARP